MDILELLRGIFFALKLQIQPCLKNPRTIGEVQSSNLARIQPETGMEQLRTLNRSVCKICLRMTELSQAELTKADLIYT